MAEMMTPQGLVVGLIPDQSGPKSEAKAADAEPAKKPGRPPKQK